MSIFTERFFNKVRQGTTEGYGWRSISPRLLTSVPFTAIARRMGKGEQARTYLTMLQNDLRRRLESRHPFVAPTTSGYSARMPSGRRMRI